MLIFDLCSCCSLQEDARFLKRFRDASTMKEIVVVVKDIDAIYLQAAPFQRLIGKCGGPMAIRLLHVLLFMLPQLLHPCRSHLKPASVPAAATFNLPLCATIGLLKRLICRWTLGMIWPDMQVSCAGGGRGTQGGGGGRRAGGDPTLTRKQSTVKTAAPSSLTRLQVFTHSVSGIELREVDDDGFETPLELCGLKHRRIHLAIQVCVLDLRVVAWWASGAAGLADL